VSASDDVGSVPKRPKGADCKSAGLCLRRFESFPAHNHFGLINIERKIFK
jgi:hypothetical protein